MKQLQTVTSVSGGKTSAYLAANYQTDYNVFALVRIEDKKCLFPDKKIRQEVEDRIQKPFIATAEDDMIIYTMLDLEQFLGKKIDWVSGDTFDFVAQNRGGWLPNKLHRYCTAYMKIEPIFYWWAEKFKMEPAIFHIGFRANEMRRAKKTSAKCDEFGRLIFKATFEKHENGNNKWVDVPWQIPRFPLIDNQIYKDEIVNFWNDKPVRFAELNNCVGCFHRNPLLLRKMYDKHPKKIQWFADQEKPEKGTWRSDMRYDQIIRHNLQNELSFDDFDDCDSGYCGL